MEEVNKKYIPKSLMILFVILVALVAVFFLYQSSLGNGLKSKQTLEELEAEKGPDGQPIIFLRIVQDDQRAITKMLDLGYDIETKGGFDITPIIDAALSDNWIIVLMLLERGADPLAAGRNGITMTLLMNTSRVDLDGRYGIALTQVRDFLDERGIDTTSYEPPQVKEMLKNGEWPPMKVE